MSASDCHAELVGYLDVHDEYDGWDNWIGTRLEVYSDGPNLGKYQDVTEFLLAFDGRRVRITVDASPRPA